MTPAINDFAEIERRRKEIEAERMAEIVKKPVEEQDLTVATGGMANIYGSVFG